MKNPVIRIKLKAFDHRVLDKAVQSIVSTVKRTGAVVKGPVPMPVKKLRVTVNRSTHVNKKSREQFESREFTRLLDIHASAQTIEALSKLDLAAGVDVEIKNKEEN
jgi:small subunit ribosomal protein S10